MMDANAIASNGWTYCSSHNGPPATLVKVSCHLVAKWVNSCNAEEEEKILHRH